MSRRWFLGVPIFRISFAALLLLSSVLAILVVIQGAVRIYDITYSATDD